MFENRVAIGAGCLVLGLVLGYGSSALIGISPSNNERIIREGGYEFINPLISCNISDEQQYPGFASLHTKLDVAIHAHLRSGDAERISIYVRDMDNGQWTGVNADELYIPASLVKVPFLIALLRQDRDDATLFDKRVIFTSAGASPLVEQYPPSVRLSVGESHTLRELVDAMIKRSDNDATLLVAPFITEQALSEVYTSFDVPPLQDPDAAMVSPNLYMRFFRILYNASYLGRVRSQTALTLLSETEFTQGIVAGLPTGRTVSHKFGERTTDRAGATMHLLHDCGIVYYPHSPYGICVMTEGADFDRLSTIIADLSTITYRAIEAGLMKNDGPTQD